MEATAVSQSHKYEHELQQQQQKSITLFRKKNCLYLNAITGFWEKLFTPFFEIFKNENLEVLPAQ